MVLAIFFCSCFLVASCSEVPMAEKTSNMVQVKVRMPKSLQRKIQRDAERQGLTINAEILRRLEASYQSDTVLDRIGELSDAQKKTAEIVYLVMNKWMIKDKADD